ncbi:MAG: hypothetical protein ABIV21_00535 [Pyrinomonadaceae bacterium]
MKFPLLLAILSTLAFTAAAQPAKISHDDAERSRMPPALASSVAKGRPYQIRCSGCRTVRGEVVNIRIWEGIHFRFGDEKARKQG